MHTTDCCPSMHASPMDAVAAGWGEGAGDPLGLLLVLLLGVTALLLGGIGPMTRDLTRSPACAPFTSITSCRLDTSHA